MNAEDKDGDTALQAASAKATKQLSACCWTEEQQTLTQRVDGITGNRGADVYARGGRYSDAIETAPSNYRHGIVQLLRNGPSITRGV